MSKCKLIQKLLILPLVSLVFIGCNKSSDSGTSQGTNNLNNQIETVKQNIDDLTKNKPDLPTLNQPNDEFTKNLKTLRTNYDSLKLPASQNAEIDKRILILWLPLYKKDTEITEAQKGLFGTANPIPTSEIGKFDASAKNTQTKYVEESPKLVRDLQLKLLENQASSLKQENSELAKKKSLYETSNLIQIILFLSLIALVFSLIGLIVLIIIKVVLNKDAKFTLDLSKNSSITIKPEIDNKTLINLIEKYTAKLNEKAPNVSPLIDQIEPLLKKVLEVLNKIIETPSIEPRLKTIENSLEEIKPKINQVPGNSGQKDTEKETPTSQLPIPYLPISNDQNQRELVVIYNDNKLQSMYKNLIAVSTEPTSIETSRTGSGKKPILTQQSPSKYWIVSISGNLYLVPKEDALNTNDMTSVEVLFECQGYKKDVSNPKDFQLVKAGKVSGGNEQWVLEEAGVLKYS